MTILELIEEQKIEFEKKFVKTLRWEQGSLQAIIFEGEKDTAIYDWHITSIIQLLEAIVEGMKEEIYEWSDIGNDPCMILANKCVNACLYQQINNLTEVIQKLK